MKLQDALFNWLQIAIVAKERPDDEAAVETVAFFRQILDEDHGVTELAWDEAEDRFDVRYRIGEQPELSQRFDREYAEQLLRGLEGDSRCGPPGSEPWEDDGL